MIQIVRQFPTPMAVTCTNRPTHTSSHMHKKKTYNFILSRREISSKLVLPFDQKLSNSKVTVVFLSILLILITRLSFKSLIPYYKKPTGSKVVTQIVHFDVSQFQTLMAAATFQTKGRGWDGQKRYKGMGLLTFSTSTDLNFLCCLASAFPNNGIYHEP